MATLTEVPVPDIGDFSDVPITAVLVAVGDTVAEEDPLVEIESDKATMEVPAPLAGTVKELKVEVGDTVSEGTVICVLEPSDGGDDEDDEPEASDQDGGEEEPEASDEGGGDEEPEASDEDGGEEEPDASGEDGGDDPVYASPAVRRAAREQGVDLSTVSGTGRKGRILREDLDAAGAATAPAAGSGKPQAGEERVALTRIQRLSRDSLTTSWAAPHVTHHESADVTSLEQFRKRLNAEQDDVKVTMVALLLKASAATLDVFPRFASSLDGDELVVKPQRHLGFAADTPDGLVVPVIRDVDRKGLLDLAGELTELSGKARAGKLGPKDMSGAVFTISSLGGIGGTGFTPIVNAPQVAILGAVRSAMRPVWDGAEFVPRLMLPLSLSYDHRVIDGAAAARFCVHLKGVLEDLRRVLL